MPKKGAGVELPRLRPCVVLRYQGAVASQAMATPDVRDEANPLARALDSVRTNLRGQNLAGFDSILQTSARCGRLTRSSRWGWDAAAESVETFSHIGGWRVDEDFHAAAEAQHERPPAALRRRAAVATVVAATGIVAAGTSNNC